MPKDVKFGLILVVGVALVCGVKRISLQSHNAPSTPVAANSSTTKEAAPPALTLPDVPKAAAPKEVAAVVKPAVAATGKAKKDISKQVDATTEKSDEAVTNLFPKDLRDKVKQTGDEADKKLEDLELPGDLTLPAETKATPAASKKKTPLGNSKSSLPPVKSKDAVKPAAKESANDGLTLPGDDFLKNSGSEEPTAPKKKSSSSDGDFPKPLPEASNASVGSGKGPAHPYFLRFVKEGSYFVRDGDTLRSIAYNLYQDESKAGEILELNRAELKSPSDLRAGMRIRLPK